MPVAIRPRQVPAEMERLYQRQILCEQYTYLIDHQDSERVRFLDLRHVLLKPFRQQKPLVATATAVPCDHIVE